MIVKSALQRISRPNFLRPNVFAPKCARTQMSAPRCLRQVNNFAVCAKLTILLLPITN